MISFKPAKRENVPLLIGLDGASGSGKTYCALLLGEGIANEIARVEQREPRLFGIDTERGRMLHYADEFRFMHAELGPPFRPNRYKEAIQSAEDAGADVIVIDSFSHEWEGEGGVKEWADEILASNPNMKSPAQWNIPKAGPEGHKRLVNFMLAAKPHIIVCLRSEEKMKMEQVPELNPDGSPKMYKGRQVKKTVITAAGDMPLRQRWVPICEKRFPFEITTSLLLTPDNPGVPIPRKLSRQHRPFFPEGAQITRDAGRQLAAWALGSPVSQGSTSSAPTPLPGLSEARQALSAAANEGTAALETAWKAKSMAPFRETLQPELASLKSTAAVSDAYHQPQGQDDYEGV